MKTSNFNYQLPENLIAKHPPKTRGKSRLLVIHRPKSRDRIANSQDLPGLRNQIEHRKYSDLVNYFSPGDVLILNNTKVFKARLTVTKSTGEPRELLVLEKHSQTYPPNQALVSFYGRIQTGNTLKSKTATIRVLKRFADATALIKADKPIKEILEKEANLPLPPYLQRQATKQDELRYQTQFAEKKGSVAAPTASLNFTKDLEKKLVDKGVIIKPLTLHIGLGTFRPIWVKDLSKHHMHQEFFEIPVETVQAIKQAKSQGKSVVALGTTVTRALEYSKNVILSEVEESLPAQAGLSLSEQNTISGEADIFIYPGYKFKIVDKLITNFHAPKSTVLMMATAFAGWPLLKKAYQEAIKHKYAFLSYGDTTLIL